MEGGDGGSWSTGNCTGLLMGLISEGTQADCLLSSTDTQHDYENGELAHMGADAVSFKHCCHFNAVLLYKYNSCIYTTVPVHYVTVLS